MSQFKAMKFWIGDDDVLHESIQRLLFGLGYGWTISRLKEVRYTDTLALYTSDEGLITYTGSSSGREYFDELEGKEEINIDWMRTPKKETIELNGKKYLKEDLEEALKHIKPMEE